MKWASPIMLLALTIVLPMGRALPDERDTPPDPRVKAAVDKALAFLAQTQQPNGSWRCRVGARGLGELGQSDEHVGITALALLAFMGDGNLPDRGKYADVVARGLDFVLKCAQDATGYVSSNGTNMYSHGFATLFLAEMYGMTGRKDVKDALKKSVDLLTLCQNSQGGWRYQPNPSDADLSITVCQIQALRAARNRGVAVKKSVIEKALQYVKGCELPDGGFSYQYQTQRKITQIGSSSAGLVSYYSMGIYDEKAHEKHFQYLLNQVEGGKLKGGNHFFYSHYYAVQAFYQRGGDYWKKYWTTISEYLIKSQHAEGYWSDEVGPPYATAMACIILQVPKEVLPILQK